MADYDVYAVVKDDDDNILCCYVSDLISNTFLSVDEAESYISNNCKIKTKTEVMNDINEGESIPYTRILDKQSYNYQFSYGAKILVVANKYLRTEANSTTKDNLDDIMEIE